MGDLDDDDWDRLLVLQEAVDSDGFPIEFRQWARAGKDENDVEYEHWMFDIDGDLWFDKFDSTSSDEYVSIKRAGV